MAGDLDIMLAEVVAVSVIAVVLVRAHRQNWLIPFAILVSAAGGYCEVHYGHSTDGPAWLAYLVAAVYSSGAIFAAVLARPVRRVTVHLAATLLGGLGGIVCSMVIAVLSWHIVSWVS